MDYELCEGCEYQFEPGGCGTCMVRFREENRKQLRAMGWVALALFVAVTITVVCLV